MENIAISLDGICKSFTIQVLDESKGFSKYKKCNKDVLKDITFSIKKGEIVGIIGRNGSGKSTLLKIISKIMDADSGKIEINGQIASILELGVGFHPDMTGRENIYLKGELYGFSKKDIDEKIDEIIDYASIGDYIDNPIRTYSSGMSGRLAFALMTHLNADIILIDEVLSVGDLSFSSKAREHFKKMTKSGKTIILVSHGLSTIEQMCTRTIWIDSGIIKKDGKTKEVLSAYQRSILESIDVIKDMAVNGIPDAQYKLSQMFKVGDQVQKDMEQYRYWLLEASNHGQAQAQLEYANLLFDGSEEDKQQSMKIYEELSIKGNKEAIIKMVAYGHNSDYSELIDELKTIFKQLALRGNPLDEYRYADLLLNTALENSDKQDAFGWFMKSANHYNYDATYQVAMMYRDGIGIDKNYDEMINHLIIAAEHGHGKSMMQLAELYYLGKIVPIDESKAFYWYSKASEIGNAKAQHQLALMYHNGEGVEKDEEKSYEMYTKCAYTNLNSYFLWAADSLKYNPVNTLIKPEKLYEIAAHTGNKSACVQLGNLYRNGSMVGLPNLEIARAYYEKASLTWGSQTYLADLLCEISTDKETLDRIMSIYESASAYGDGAAAYRLAKYYQNMFGEEKQMEVLRLLNIAVERGNKDAMIMKIQIENKSNVK